MILWIVNKLPKPIRVYLKNRFLRRMLNQKLAEETSQKIVTLSAEKLRNELSNDDVDREKIDIEKTIAYKKDALEHFKFIATPSEFQKSVIYPLVVNIAIFLVGIITGAIAQHKDIFTKTFNLFK